MPEFFLSCHSLIMYGFIINIHTIKICHEQIIGCTLLNRCLHQNESAIALWKSETGWVTIWRWLAPHPNKSNFLVWRVLPITTDQPWHWAGLGWAFLGQAWWASGPEPWPCTSLNCPLACLSSRAITRQLDCCHKTHTV